MKIDVELDLSQEYSSKAKELYLSTNNTDIESRCRKLKESKSSIRSARAWLNNAEEDIDSLIQLFDLDGQLIKPKFGR